MPAEMLDRLTEDVGGFNNASTFDDSTELLRSRAVEPPRDAAVGRGRAHGLAQRRRGELQVRARGGQGGVSPARPGPAVRAALLRCICVRPIVRRASLRAAGHRQHRGARRRDARRRARLPRAPTIGRTTPSLIVAGDFEQQQLDAWVDQYFAAVPRRRNAAMPRVTAVRARPARAPKSLTLYAPNVPLPAVAITWLAPPRDERRRRRPCRCSAPSCSAGESSRLNQSLVYRAAARRPGRLRADLRVGPGAATRLSRSSPAASSADSRPKALLAESHAFATARRRAPPSSPKAKTQLDHRRLQQRQTPLRPRLGDRRGRGPRYGDPARVNTAPGRAAARDSRRRAARRAKRIM